MDKATIADVLEKIATLLELKDENPFKIRAYTNAARSLETWGGHVADLRDEETLEKIPGIGKAIAAKIKELVETGSLKFFDDLRAEFPADILELFTVPGLGAKKIKALHEKLQVSSIAQLHEACLAGRVAELPGFGKTTQEKICKSIDERQKFAGSFQLGQIAAEAETCKVICAPIPRRSTLHRRQLSTPEGNRARSGLHRGPLPPPRKSPRHSSDIRWSNQSSRRADQIERALAFGDQSDLRVVSAADVSFALIIITGSKEHNIVMRNRALQHCWTLKEYRLGEVPLDPAAKTKNFRRKFADSRGGRSLSRARARLHSAEAARELRRIRRGRGRKTSAPGRS